MNTTRIARTVLPIAGIALLAACAAPAAHTADVPTPGSTSKSAPAVDDQGIAAVAPVHVAAAPVLAPVEVTAPATSPSSQGKSVATAPAGVPHFATPEAAMRYLVTAYNKHDMAAEMHVTTPDSRAQLETERQWVQTFAFNSCSPNPGGGDYTCQLDMATKVQPDDPNTAMGEVSVIVAPAARTGWYLYANNGCGE
jgi:hypothetical protein